MNRKLASWWLIVVCVFLVGNSLWLASCAQQELAAKQPMSTPTGIATMRPRETSWINKPGYVIGDLVTPLPGERVRVGDVTEVAQVRPVATSTPPRYSVRTDIPPWRPHTKPDEPVEVEKLFVRDSKTGQETRLGDDDGHALLEAVTDQYVIWKYIRHGHSDPLGLKTGLYAYVLATGDKVVIAQEPGYPWDSKIEGQWVVYRFPGKGDKYLTRLRARNLATGEDFLAGEKSLYNQPEDPFYYALDGHRVAWVEGKTINVCDLATRATRVLKIPPTTRPVGLSFSGDIVVWWDQYWKGYDLRQDAVFTIPTIPPGWENMPVNNISRVTVKDDRLYWSFELGGRTYNLTAPIIRDR